MPSDEPYHLLHTASMVGLFNCVFIKASQRTQVSNVNAAELKRGMGGLHGNKVSITPKFLGYVADISALGRFNSTLYTRRYFLMSSQLPSRRWSKSDSQPH